MRAARVLIFAALAIGFVAESVRSDDKADKQKLRKKLQEMKKAAEEKAAADAKKADTAKKTAALAKDATPTLAPQTPKFIGGSKDAVAVARFIDAEIEKLLAADKITPAPLCTDAEFVRRVYLDIAGVVPTGEKAKAFIDDKSPDKRAKLIDELLAAPGFGHRQADIWTARLIERSSDNRRVDFSGFRPWLADRFNAGAGWNQIVTDIVAASGSPEKAPAVDFYLSNNTVDKMTDEVCKTFLGVQLQCAQCHNHPFTTWKQTEYWAMAQFFIKTQVGGLGKDQTPSVTETANVRRNQKMNPLPEAYKDVPAKFLQAESPTMTGDYRPVLAKWMTSATNPFFAKAMVNRTWAELFGRGIVNPVDDMHEGNEASHPELLKSLAADFAAAGFDTRHLIRSICLTKAYQRSSKTADSEADDDGDYGHMPMKVLAPEQLFDSLAQVTGFAEQAKGRDKTAKGPQGSPRERFVLFYLAGAEQPNAMEYEAGIPQALKLMNSRIAGNPAAVRRFVTGKPADVFENLYLATVSRRPTADEVARLSAYVAKAPTAADGYADVLWALLNSSEFTLNR